MSSSKADNSFISQISAV